MNNLEKQNTNLSNKKNPNPINHSTSGLIIVNNQTTINKSNTKYSIFDDANGIAKNQITTVIGKQNTFVSKFTGNKNHTCEFLTKERATVIIPEWINKKIGVYNGKQYITVTIKPLMVGFKLGEFSWTTKTAKYTKSKTK